MRFRLVETQDSWLTKQNRSDKDDLCKARGYKNYTDYTRQTGNMLTLHHPNGDPYDRRSGNQIYIEYSKELDQNILHQLVEFTRNFDSFEQMLDFIQNTHVWMYNNENGSHYGFKLKHFLKDNI